MLRLSQLTSIKGTKGVHGVIRGRVRQVRGDLSPAALVLLGVIILGYFRLPFGYFQLAFGYLLVTFLVRFWLLSVKFWLPFGYLFDYLFGYLLIIYLWSSYSRAALTCTRRRRFMVTNAFRFQLVHFCFRSQRVAASRPDSSTPQILCMWA